jgi:hypothetical protein
VEEDANEGARVMFTNARLAASDRKLRVNMEMRGGGARGRAEGGGGSSVVVLLDDLRTKFSLHFILFSSRDLFCYWCDSLVAHSEKKILRRSHT